MKLMKGDIPTFSLYLSCKCTKKYQTNASITDFNIAIYILIHTDDVYDFSFHKY